MRTGSSDSARILCIVWYAPGRHIGSGPIPKQQKSPETSSFQDFFGASDVTRTRDLLITSEMHYRLCYTSKYLAQSLY